MPVVAVLGEPIAAAFVAAAFAFLLWALWTFLGNPLTQLVSALPVVGGSAASAVMSMVNRVQAWVAAWIDGNLGAIVQIVSAPIHWVEWLFESILDAYDAMIAQLNTVASAAAGAIGSVGAALNDLRAGIANVAYWLGVTERQATETADRLAGVEATVIPAGLAATLAQARAAATALVDGEAAARAQAIVTAGAALAATLAAEQAARIAGQNAAAAALATEAARLEAAIAGVVSGPIAGIDVRLGDLEGVAGTLAGLLGGVAVVPLAAELTQVVTRVETMDRECVSPICSAITPQLGTLNALLDAGLMVGLFAVVADAIRDPHGAGQAAAAVAGDLHGLAAGVLDPLIGARL